MSALPMEKRGFGEDGPNTFNTNGHGNNKTLKELISIDSKHGENFQFSILMNF